tara:strand:- start:271 stop:498 length:228 start_codon:yes stop_codon:yes gene_type:complete
MIIIAKEYKYHKSEKLFQCYCNARRTYFGALGHNKAEMNDRISKDYAEELKRREFDVPTDDDVEKRGIFNGDGSW